MIAWLRFLPFLLIGCVLAASPYQVLRGTGEGYARVTPDRPFDFPQDHLPHPDYRIEWWYLTANLTDDQGRDWGVQWTLFRQALAPAGPDSGWASRQVWMAHVALTGPDGHHVGERFARGGIGQAGVEMTDDGRLDAWLDDWRLTGAGPSPLPGQLKVSVDGVDLNLTLTSDTPWVLQGDRGYSRKSVQGQASYYYSQPHIQASGQVNTPEGSVALTGQAWLDREWSSQPLADDQPGWDWFALHLADGHALMVYRLRTTEGPAWLSGTWIDPDGTAHPLSGDAIELTEIRRTSVHTGTNQTRDLPLSWDLALPGLDRHWRITAPNPEQWLPTRFPYWEGPIRAEGSSDGVGYLELTGY